MKFYLYYLILLTLFITACSNGQPEISPEPVNPSDITVHLRLSTSTETRIDREPSQSGSSANVYTAIVYFLDGQEDPLCWGVTTVGAANADITVDELLAGAVVKGPSQAKQVYVVGNWNSCDSLGNYAAFPTVAGYRFSHIRSTVLDINQVAYWKLADGTTLGNATDPTANNDVYKVAIMDGLAPIQEYSVNPGGWNGGPGPAEGDSYADFTLTPLVARLEWSFMLFAINSNVYTINEIFINNYYQKLPLSLDDQDFSITHNKNDPEKYTLGNSSFAYNNYRAMYIPFYYNPNNPSDEDVALTAGDDNVFAFHIFGGTPVPELVIRFTDIYYRRNPTVRVPEGYAVIKFRDQQGNEITEFEKNKIYKPYQYISDFYGLRNGFRVDYYTLPPTPDPDPNPEIWIEMEVKDWIDVNITSVL